MQVYRKRKIKKLSCLEDALPFNQSQSKIQTHTVA
jgi:hypothetical protein